MTAPFETIINAATGEQTVREFTSAEIAEFSANLRERKIAALADLRWQRETGGMIFNDHLVATDAVSQTKIIGAVVGAQIDPTSTIQWKMADGEFVTLDAAAMVALATAMRAHVQACFDNEATLRAQIEAAPNDAAVAAIDILTGWPV